MITPEQYINIDAYDQFKILDNVDRGILDDTLEQEWHLFGVKGTEDILIDVWFSQKNALEWLQRMMEDIGAFQ